jgi:chemotaxis protein MotA
MNILVGLAGTIAIFALTLTADSQHAFTGILYRPALQLLVFAPPSIALLSYKFEDLFACLRAVARAARFSVPASRAALYDDFAAFAAELRQRRPAEALAVGERSGNRLFNQLAPLVVKQMPGDEIEKFAAAASFAISSALKRSEDVLTSLARISPAVGLIGTVMGLIALLKDLSRFEQLGPSMALALLCTFYGLVAANVVYQPLQRLLHFQASALLEESRLLTRALVMLGEGATLADARSLFQPGPDREGPAVAQPSPAP